jgi:hypothetical protein
MTEYLKNPNTDSIYEVVGEYEKYVWARRLSDGFLDTWHRAALEPYTPTPVVGEVWKDFRGEDVVIVGYDGVAEQYVTVPVTNEVWTDVAVTPFPREELFVKPREPEPVKPDARAAEVAAFEAETDALADAAALNERHGKL